MLRYSALAFGVFYGFSHQRSITSAQKASEAQKAYEHKQKLIEQAKAEYSKSKNPPTTQKGGRKSSHVPEASVAVSWACPGPLPLHARIVVLHICHILTRAVSAIVNQDPMSPNFDLEAFFNGLMDQKA